MTSSTFDLGLNPFLLQGARGTAIGMLSTGSFSLRCLVTGEIVFTEYVHADILLTYLAMLQKPLKLIQADYRETEHASVT